MKQRAGIKPGPVLRTQAGCSLVDLGHITHLLQPLITVQHLIGFFATFQHSDYKEVNDCS